MKATPDNASNNSEHAQMLIGRPWKFWWQIMNPKVLSRLKVCLVLWLGVETDLI